MKFVEFKKAGSARKIVIIKHDIYKIEEVTEVINFISVLCIAISYNSPGSTETILVDHKLSEVMELIK